MRVFEKGFLAWKSETEIKFYGVMMFIIGIIYLIINRLTGWAIYYALFEVCLFLTVMYFVELKYRHQKANLIEAVNKIGKKIDDKDDIMIDYLNLKLGRISDEIKVTDTVIEEELKKQLSKYSIKKKK